MGEAWGEQEARLKLPFVGPSGAELIRQFREAGLMTLTQFDWTYLEKFYNTKDPECLAAIWSLHPEIYRTNVFQLRPPDNDLSFVLGPKSSAIPGYPALKFTKAKFPGTHVRQEFEPELERLADEIINVDPNLIILFGNVPLWAIAGRTAITKCRGTIIKSTHTVLDYKCLPTLHPAYILRSRSDRPTVIADLMKAERESKYPEIRRPHREIWIEPTLEDVRTFIVDHVKKCELLSVDIETSGTRITCIGLSPHSGLGIVIPFDDERRKDGNYWPTIDDERACWNLIREVLEDPNIEKLFQNGLYDIAFLYRSMSIRTFGATHDTMLMAHAQQPENLKGLGYLASIYSDERSWKHLGKRHRTIKREN